MVDLLIKAPTARDSETEILCNMLYILVVKWDTIVHSQHLMGNVQIYISFTQKQMKAI